MIDPDAARRMNGDIVVDVDGRDIGQIVEVYVDPESGVPAWAAVDTGLFGTSRTVVPLAQAEFMGNRLRIAYDKRTVDSAPAVQPEHGQLTSAAAVELSRHYGIVAARTGHGPGMAAAGRDSDASGGIALTRSAERLQVSTEWLATERVRVRKVTVTEHVTVTVPVSREELRIEREVIEGGKAGGASEAPATSHLQHDIVLHAERPVVTTEVVPVERVRVSTVLVAGQETVSESLREERIDAETDLGSSPGDR